MRSIKSSDTNSIYTPRSHEIVELSSRERERARTYLHEQESQRWHEPTPKARRPASGSTSHATTDRSRSASSQSLAPSMPTAYPCRCPVVDAESLSSKYLARERERERERERDRDGFRRHIKPQWEVYGTGRPMRAIRSGRATAVVNERVATAVIVRRRAFSVRSMIERTRERTERKRLFDRDRRNVENDIDPSLLVCWCWCWCVDR